MIKTIIFDLNKVLVTYDKSDLAFIENFGIDRETFWKNRKEDLEKYELDEITLSELLSNQLDKNNLPKEKLAIALEIYKDGLRVVKEMPELLDKLSKKYDLILLAGDGKEALSLKLDKFNLQKYFKKIYATCFLKMRKTDKEIYEIVLRENNLSPEKVIFIDDQQRYIDAAEKAGIKTIKFENPEQLTSSLINLQIL